MWPIAFLILLLSFNTVAGRGRSPSSRSTSEEPRRSFAECTAKCYKDYQKWTNKLEEAKNCIASCRSGHN
ncbi:unnamed protein product [Cylicocyclus nassatus]|uniref:Uncharacterized protein n=1 Tax=Cylicocyclus nassatus TaxID=53992 RepID=A0AA36GSP0_CYLNA|nr:unnamed protein product [Cylicocyclus nassatus]